MKHRSYTVTEIAEAICEADGLALADHTRAHSQVRNAVRQRLLEDGKQIDGRGTVAFPVREIYRARIINALADLSIDMVAVRDVLAEAARDSSPALLTENWPARTKVDGGWRWQGFDDVIRGVACGEPWILRLSLYRPGYLHGKRLQARFIWTEAPDVKDGDNRETENVTGTGPAQVVVNVSLNVLFAGLPELANA